MLKALLLILTSSLLFLTSCTKIPRAALSFHTQTPKGESKKMVFKYNVGEQAINMRRMPDFVLSNVKTYRPFPAKDGGTYGAMFLLDLTSAKRLLHYTTQNQGKYMVSMINGKVSAPLMVDKPINDGVLIIWEGLSLRDLRSLDIEIPRTGEDEDEWKKRSKKAKKALKNIIKAEKSAKKKKG